MPDGTSKPRLTPLFSNRVMSRLERLRINPRRRLTSRRRGEHQAGKEGRSIDFSDYRDYVPGDDVRFVDWNIFARLNRPYLKLYHQEEEMHVVLLVDASASMGFGGKLRRARQLAAAFGAMGLLGRERVGAFAFNALEGALDRLHPSTGRASLGGLFRFVEGVESGGDEPVEDGIRAALKYHTGRGVALVLSDFLTFGRVRPALNLLFSCGLEIFAVQILAPAELDPDVSDNLRLVDSETGENLDVSSAARLLDVYHEYRERLQRDLAEQCRGRGGRFLSISSQDPLDWVLFDLMVRKGWLA